MKKMEMNEQMREASKPTARSGWQTQGNKRRKSMTAEDMLRKVRAKK